ncbi:DUF3847 domain-containing protein [Chakrabartyella piscis]|uniref:DUF3847 domain-containing protein n=1 Tax=Chakrabartyella piscis TaxID=2918914 RepID=UPI002958A513|nr:DUF3847 domain-containing protein [Chakrabartyella piscis]
MTKKTIVEQIKETQIEIEKTRTEKKQKEHQLEKLQKREREKNRSKRTRNLIEKGAILESINPSIQSLSNEQLQAFLQQVLQSERALHLLSKMTATEDTQ